ncbi:hypothetical protein ACMFMG_000191 [Clarireedia jacksonii]
MATEPTDVSETTATVQVQPEPTNDKIDFDAKFVGTVWVKWDVKGGGDRTHEPYIDTNYSLEGSPNIQGVEIKSGIAVRLLAWASSYPNGTPDLIIDGPTNGKHKVNPRRLGSYRVELR